MKKQILSLMALTAALTACDSFEATDHTNPTPYSIEEGVIADDTEEPTVDEVSDEVYVTLDTSEGSETLSGADLVDVIPEINIAVYEIGADQYVDQSENIRSDEQVDIQSETGLSTENDLWESLVAEVDMMVGVVGAAPEELIQLCDANGNKVVVFQEAGESLYQSEVAKGVLEASESDVDYLFIPVEKIELSDALIAAVSIAQSKDIQVFDREGKRI